MNKKVNLYLNGFEFITYILSLSLMGIYLNINIIVIRQLIFLLGAISGLVFIGIELFLLLIMNNKSRFAYITYMLFSIILGTIINTKIPYSAFIIFSIFSLTKDILRLLLVEKIYDKKLYKRYAKMFNIEVKDLEKRVIKTFNRTKVVIPVGNLTTFKRKTNKEYKKDLA
ncbi:MAG: hypothetical protein IJ097_00470 [Bacilli bacterium]|nr:hypothetical protein [Bacilli bacterium]